VNTKFPYIPTSFKGENTGEVNKTSRRYCTNMNMKVWGIAV
jgi:hypothetical protein